MHSRLAIESAKHYTGNIKHKYKYSTSNLSSNIETYRDEIRFSILIATEESDDNKNDM